MTHEELTGCEALYQSMEKCKRGVRWKGSVAYFLHNWPSEIRKLSDQLQDGTYQERKARYFWITEPKVREIMSIPFRDRVYQRSLNDTALYPQMTKSYIPDNFACQTGKGTDAARDRLKEFLREFYRKNGLNGYVLKADIEGYYRNIDHRIAKDLIESRVDPVSFSEAERVLRSFRGEVGYNPGSQIVQIIGVTLLDKMDHFIKERLHIRYYIRYMDDFILMDPDKDKLIKAKELIAEELAKIGLHLSEKKTFIQPISRPILFLGFKFRATPTGKVVILADPKKIKHEKLKLKRMVALARKGERTKREVDKHFKAWKVTVRYGDSKLLLQKLNKWYKELWNDGNCEVQTESGRAQGSPECNRERRRSGHDD